MSFNIVRVISNSFKMVQERWLTMIALWATFIGFLMLYGLAFFAVIGGSMLALVGSITNPAALQDPAALGGLGIGFMLLLLVFYVGYIAIALGQAASMVAAASAMERINFGEAFGRGLKGGLTMLGVFVLMVIAGFIGSLLLTLVGAVMVAVLGEFGMLLGYLMLFPLFVYLACRFAVIVPVIVVEKVFNPIAAINRTWQITSGKALGIFVLVLLYGVIAVVLLLLLGMMFSGLGVAATVDTEPGIGSMVFMFICLLVVSCFITLLYCAMQASLHAEISDKQASELSKAFE